MEHTIESLITAWKQARVKARDTDDPLLLAGSYLDWANGDARRAILYVEAAASGQYIDMPRFAGCDETLNVLRKLSDSTKVT
jgi:hypothetical protein